MQACSRAASQSLAPRLDARRRGAVWHGVAGRARKRGARRGGRLAEQAAQEGAQRAALAAAAGAAAAGAAAVRCLAHQAAQRLPGRVAGLQVRGHQLLGRLRAARRTRCLGAEALHAAESPAARVADRLTHVLPLRNEVPALMMAFKRGRCDVR